MKDLKISKELLSYVFTDNQQDFKINSIEKDTLYYSWLNEGYFGDGEVNCKWENMSINIYEFAFLCKDWALKKGYMMKIENHYSNNILIQIRKTIPKSLYIDPWKKTFKSEVEAIIKACEWILKETGN